MTSDFLLSIGGIFGFVIVLRIEQPDCSYFSLSGFVRYVNSLMYLCVGIRQLKRTWKSL
ncbi:hypothetical protein HanXRQr2_Chr14g0659121 [Helianthus annuus]|uniref:Uncharacterized protein n=1 Tax=Helianthus annuus TaxID=4232 RepID=A0A251SK96_HELAN|nr:hypothetical protein HanXRQr2_Chr14g0659121 [Helianthus annuus]KAJ0841594.1 hypothetical protein HanPSC8_Chr14g0632171 [Helianthus annuus]